MYTIVPAAPQDAAIMLDIQRRAFAEEGRLCGSSDIPPLTETLEAVEAAHPEVTRFELTTNTIVAGNVRFYERRGYRVTELTPYRDGIALAQMRKDVAASGA